jgi:hypothetical protein
MDSREMAGPDPGRDDARERRLDRLLGALDHDGPALGRERLERMAEAALQDAARGVDPDAATPSSRSPAVPIFWLRRPWARVAAAAALLLAVTFGVRLALRADPGGTGPSPGAPACLDEADFLTNFDVIRDLRDLDADGELFDLDDDVLILQALQGA